MFLLVAFCFSFYHDIFFPSLFFYIHYNIHGFMEDQPVARGYYQANGGQVNMEGRYGITGWNEETEQPFFFRGLL